MSSRFYSRVIEKRTSKALVPEGLSSDDKSEDERNGLFCLEESSVQIAYSTR
jgi:hypothetical protein